MQYGKVIEYFPKKGFGFIRSDYRTDVFFHITALGACQQQPEIRPGQAVKFELVPGTEPNRRRPRFDEEPVAAEVPPRLQAQIVELIDRIPGAIMSEVGKQTTSRKHPKARHRKPNWRR